MPGYGFQLLVLLPISRVPSAGGADEDAQLHLPCSDLFFPSQLFPNEKDQNNESSYMSLQHLEESMLAEVCF